MRKFSIGSAERRLTKVSLSVISMNVSLIYQPNMVNFEPDHFLSLNVPFEILTN